MLGTTYRRRQTPVHFRINTSLTTTLHQSPCAGNRQAVAATGSPTMPDEPPRRIIIEKSSTVRRRHQRSNKRFKFTAEEIARIERELKAEKRAKELREKEDKRLAKKRKKAEKEARDREERKRLGIPDPNAPKVPSSQPLLSAFLAKRPASVEDKSATESPAGRSPISPDSPAEATPIEDTLAEDTPAYQSPEPDLKPESEFEHEPTTAEVEAEDHEVIANAESGPELESEPKPESVHETTITETKENDHEVIAIAESEPEPKPEPKSDHEPTTTETKINDRQDIAIAEVESAAGDTEVDSNFEDWDEELERELSNLQGAGVPGDSKIPDAGHDTSKDTLQKTMCTDRDDDEFSDCSVFDDEDIIRAAIENPQSAQNTPEFKGLPPSNAPAIQSPSSNRPKDPANPVVSVGDSFRDETADLMEEGWFDLLEHESYDLFVRC